MKIPVCPRNFVPKCRLCAEAAKEKDIPEFCTLPKFGNVFFLWPMDYSPKAFLMESTASSFSQPKNWTSLSVWWPGLPTFTVLVYGLRPK